MVVWVVCRNLQCLFRSPLIFCSLNFRAVDGSVAEQVRSLSTVFVLIQREAKQEKQKSGKTWALDLQL